MLLVLLMTTMAIWSLMGLPMLILRRAASSAGRGMSGSAQSSLLLLVMSVVAPEWPWKSISGMQGQTESTGVHMSGCRWALEAAMYVRWDMEMWPVFQSKHIREDSTALSP